MSDDEKPILLRRRQPEAAEPTVIEDFELTHVSLNEDGSFGIGGRAKFGQQVVLKKRTPGEQRAYWDGMKSGIDSCEAHGSEEARKMLDFARQVASTTTGELRPPLVDLSEDQS